jgi:hypothetical protein
MAVRCSRFTSVSSLFFFNDFASWRKHFFCGGAKCKKINRPDLKLETLDLKLNL